MPKIVDHQKYREELLLKCFDLFTRRGYASVTIREIAGELDVSTGLLYHYFSDKQTILQQMFEVIANREIEQVTRVAYATDDLMARVDAFFAYFKERESFFKGVLLLLLDFSKHCNSEDNAAFMNNYAGIMAREIAEAMGEEETFGVLVLNLLAGMFYLRVVVPDVLDLDEQTDLMRRILNLPNLTAKPITSQDMDFNNKCI